MFSLRNIIRAYLIFGSRKTTNLRTSIKKKPINLSSKVDTTSMTSKTTTPL